MMLAIHSNKPKRHGKEKRKKVPISRATTISNTGTMDMDWCSSCAGQFVPNLFSGTNLTAP
jgi:hypothetical protein